MRRKLVLSIISICLLLITGAVGTWAYVHYLEAYVTNLEFDAQSYGYASVSVDGLNFKEDLNLEDIQKAIVAKYNNYSFDSSGNLVNENGDSVTLTQEEINETYREIQFNPLTSTDGVNMKYVNSSGTSSTVSASSGMYVEFDLYFKSEVENSFTLYFNTEANNTDLNEQTVKISSEPIIVNSNSAFRLENGFSSYDPLTGIKTNYEADENTLSLSARDAMRFSTTVDDVTKIYEPNLGLGSYATNLESDSYNNNFRAYTARYDSTKNASFTYIKNYGHEYNALDYEELPSTYQAFEEMDSLTVTSFETLGQVKKVNFNFWLEGYDADCFQPLIGNYIKISLSFRGSDTVETYRINYVDDETTYQIEYLNSAIVTGNTPLFLTKPGYVLDGWYKDANYTEQFDFKEIITFNNQTRNAYAKWSRI